MIEIDYKNFYSADGDINLLEKSIEQDVNLCILSAKGEWKEHPTIGVGASNYIDSEQEDYEIRSDVRRELKRAFPERTFKVELTSDREIIITE